MAPKRRAAVSHAAEDLAFGDLRLFLAMAEIICEANHRGESISLSVVAQRLAEQGKKLYTVSHLSGCLTRVEDFFKDRREPLVERPRQGDCRVTESGRKALEITRNALDAYESARLAPLVVDRYSLAISSHNIYALHCLAHMLPAWREKFVDGDKTLDITIREVHSPAQGLEDLARGRTQLFIDAMEYAPPEDRFEVIDTGLEFHRTILLPQGFERDRAFAAVANEPKRWTFSQLAQVPLAYVPSRDLTRDIVVAGARSDRWAVDTTEEVHRYVAAKHGAGLSINWNRALGLPLNARMHDDQGNWPFQVRFLDAPMAPWRLYLVRPRGGKPGHELMKLIDMIENFFKCEQVLKRR